MRQNSGERLFLALCWLVHFTLAHSTIGLPRRSASAINWLMRMA
jgi:hypothetical protein